MDCLIIIVFFIALIKKFLDESGEKHSSRSIPYTSASNDQDYMNAMFVLMAAEDGVFVPGAERTFDRLDASGYENDYPDDEDGYDGYADNYAEEQDEEEYSDQWGPV